MFGDNRRLHRGLPLATNLQKESYTINLLDPHYQLGKLLSVNQRELVEVSRHRIKLLDNPNEAINDIAKNFREIRDRQRKYFPRALQKEDMAWHCYDGHLVSTTHLWLYNFGLNDVQDLKQISRSTWASLSSYTKTLAGPSILNLSLPQSPSSSLDGTVTAGDVESDRFYDHGLLSNFHDHAPSLAAILVQVNCAQFLLRDLVAQNPLTFFKLKFITAYHAFSSLNAIDASQSAIPSPAVTSFFTRIAGIPDRDWVLGQSYLRNYLVHYKPHSTVKAAMPSTATHYDVIEYLAGRKFHSMNLMLDQQLEQLSQILEADLALSHESLQAMK